MPKSSSKHTLILAALCAPALLSAGCQPGVGQCDQATLGDINPQTATTPLVGQLAVQHNCATCHSVNAVGDARVGAPAGLDFDVVPLDNSPLELAKITHGAKQVSQHREAMWGQIESGYMPPKGHGVLSASDKEAIRNWLACGAPVVDAPAMGPSGADWTSIYSMSLAPTCTVCHGTASYMGAGNGFLLGDPDTTNPANICAAYHNVVNRTAVTTQGNCASMGLTLVLPSNPDASLLYRKLAGTQTCGLGMPYGAPLGPNDRTTLAVYQWIMMGAPPPAGCP